jgi:3-mercaptopyruvate sulfurtransferase SseA
MPSRRKSKKKPFPMLALVGGGIALIVAAFLLINQNNAPAAQTAIAEEIPYPEIARVSLEDAKAALDSGSAILLDVRSADAFAGQRIAGSVNIPTGEIPARFLELDPNAWIIPYCT